MTGVTIATGVLLFCNSKEYTLFEISKCLHRLCAAAIIWSCTHWTRALRRHFGVHSHSRRVRVSVRRELWINHPAWRRKRWDPLMAAAHNLSIILQFRKGLLCSDERLNCVPFVWSPVKANERNPGCFWLIDFRVPSRRRIIVVARRIVAWR